MGVGGCRGRRRLDRKPSGVQQPQMSHCIAGTLSDGNEHNHDPLPVILIGGASGQIKGGRHIQYAAHTPMSNLLLSLLDKFGVHQDKFGDSTGKLEI